MSGVGGMLKENMMDTKEVMLWDGSFRSGKEKRGVMKTEFVKQMYVCSLRRYRRQC